MSAKIISKIDCIKKPLYKNITDGKIERLSA